MTNSDSSTACNCCKWDDDGYVHEPGCAALPPPPTGDEELITAIAVEVMKWRKDGVTESDQFWVGRRNEKMYWAKGGRAWNPCEDWNAWRQVEERILEDDAIWGSFSHSYAFRGLNPIMSYMQAPLRTRCESALKAVRSINE